MSARSCQICNQPLTGAIMAGDPPVCSRCLPLFEAKINKIIDTIADLVEEAGSSASSRTKLENYAKIILLAEEVARFESAGQEYVPGGGAFMADFHRKLQKNLVSYLIEEDVKSYLELMQNYGDDQTKMASLSDLRLRILWRRDEAERFKAPICFRLHHIFDAIKVAELAYQGKKAADAGMVDRAHKLLKGALDQLLNDDIDDRLQQKEIYQLKTALKNLQAARRAKV